MGEISLPIDILRTTAQRVVTETNNLSDETTSRWSQIHTSTSELPRSIQDVLNVFVTPLQQNFKQILTFRADIGVKLTQTACFSETLEQYIASSF
jgi:hypothetical protein